ncbi:MAG TPA: helix-turn-helix domain-containing protein [Candidatus Paceibacterota bacterium]
MTTKLRRLLTVEEVAVIFAVKPATIREWIKDGKLEATKPGRAYRIPRESVIQLAQIKFGDDSE